MKTKSLLVAGILAGMTAGASAFTLDFAGSIGAVLPPNPLTISVPGYGDVRFDAEVGTLTVDTSQTELGVAVPSLVFDTGDRVKITFLGLKPVDISSVDTRGPGENFFFAPDANPNIFYYELGGVAAGQAGLKNLSWNAVPEPSSALLGALGGALLVIRRRR